MKNVIFFDMDGTLLDTEKWYTKAWSQAFADCGYPLPMEDVLQLRSLGRPFCYDWTRKKLGPDVDLEIVRARRMEIMKPWMEEEIPLKPMVRETLTVLRERGFRTAVVTASQEERTRKLLKKTGLEGFFDQIICASMVGRGKPAPDVYLYAREQMQVPAGELHLKQNLQSGGSSAVHDAENLFDSGRIEGSTADDLLDGERIEGYTADDLLGGGRIEEYAADNLFDGELPAVYAVEDSPNGVRSAAAAGCRVIMIPDLTQPDAETEALLWKKAGTFAELVDFFPE